MRARGFTTLEVILAATLFVMISAAVFGIAATGQQMYVTSGNATKSSSRAHGIMGRIVTELRQATIKGEDRNQNNEDADLDAEDTNGNGRLEDDWSLADGTTEQWIQFNKILPGGKVTDPVRIRFDGKRILRDYQGKTAVVANDVRALTFARNGTQVVVTLYVETGRKGKQRSVSGRGLRLRRAVLIRN